MRFLPIHRECFLRVNATMGMRDTIENVSLSLSETLTMGAMGRAMNTMNPVRFQCPKIFQKLGHCAMNKLDRVDRGIVPCARLQIEKSGCLWNHKCVKESAAEN